MKFYNIAPENGYEEYMLSDNDRSYKLNQQFDSTDTLLTDWGSKEIISYCKGKKADIGYCSEPVSTLILSEKAYRELKDIFSESAELLPVKYGTETWYIVHVIKIEEDINFAQKGKIVTYIIFKNGTNERNLGNQYFFRLNDRYKETIFTEKFVSLINSLNYKGVTFKEKGEIEEEKEK